MSRSVVGVGTGGLCRVVRGDQQARPLSTGSVALGEGRSVLNLTPSSGKGGLLRFCSHFFFRERSWECSTSVNLTCVHPAGYAEPGLGGQVGSKSLLGTRRPRRVQRGCFCAGEDGAYFMSWSCWVSSGGTEGLGSADLDPSLSGSPGAGSDSVCVLRTAFCVF